MSADIDELVPRPFTLIGLVHNVAAHRRRPIHLVEWDMPTAAPCGLWVATTAGDYVFVDHAATRLLRRQTVLHELAHMLMGHQGGPTLKAHSSMLEQLQIEAAARVLGRSSYNDPEEHDAELFATVLGDRVDRGFYDQAPSPGTSTDDRRVITRFASAFGDVRRWPRADRYQRRR